MKKILDKLLKNKKVIIAIIIGAICVCTLAFIWLGIVVLGQNTVEKFVVHIEEGEYEKAEKCYEKRIIGNEERENELQNVFEDRVEELYDRINNEDIAYNDALEEIEPYSSYLRELYMQEKDKIDKLYASKESFKKGAEYFANGDYWNAIDAYVQVIEEDSNYSQAQTSFDECYAFIVNEAMISADTAAQDGDYLEAIYQLYQVKELIKKEDVALYEEKKTLYTENYYVDFMVDFYEKSDDVSSITYKDCVIEYDRIRDIEITDIVKEDGKIITYCNVLLTDGITNAVVQYMTTYGSVWCEMVPMNVISWDIPFYAEEEWKTIQEHDYEPVKKLAAVRLYSKIDDSLVTFINFEEDKKYEYEYENGKKCTEYITNCIDMDKIEYVYDNDGNLLSCVTYWRGTKAQEYLEYAYENGLMVYEKEYTPRSDRCYESYYDYILDENNYVIQKNEITYYSNDIYGDSGSYNRIHYYENDEKGNPLTISKHYEDGDLCFYYAYTYHENGKVASYTYHFYKTKVPEYTAYYDEQGNVVRIHRYSNPGWGASYYDEFEIYYEYDEQNRRIKESRYCIYSYKTVRTELKESEFIRLTDEELLQNMSEWKIE